MNRSPVLLFLCYNNYVFLRLKTRMIDDIT